MATRFNDLVRLRPGLGGLQLVRDVPRVGRKHRRPQHSFMIAAIPWEITPFFIAPVLPGETMQNMLVQARYRSDPLAEGLIDTGWWIEHQFYYVKHRDLEADSAALMAMHVENASTAALQEADGTVNFTKRCLDAVVKWYYRNEGEGVYDFVGPNGYPLASINKRHFTQTLMLDDEVVDDGAVDHSELLPGEMERYPEEIVPPGFEGAYEQYTQMLATGYTEATFEDYLASFGVKVPRELKEELHRPELIRYLRDWKLPRMAANTNGTGAACVIEDVVAERADKKRLFQEPGFLFGVCVVRPKVYFANQYRPAVHGMTTAFDWLPHVLMDAPFTSLRKFDANKGVLQDIFADQYWVDHRDIFVHGDQFYNGDIGTGVTGAEVPIGADGQRRFVNGDTGPTSNYDETPWGQLSATGDGLVKFVFDGVVNLDVLGAQIDTTPVPGGPVS